MIPREELSMNETMYSISGLMGISALIFAKASLTFNPLL
jgi:hypothetical protein